ncbi:MAG: type IV pilus modification PilV family protein [Candidatus Rifleibacteriota bacterium]
MKRRGFSLVEVLIGLVIMQIALLSFFLINESSNTQSMDAYYEFLAHSLGKEMVEFSQGMGYEWAVKYIDKPDLFPLDEWHGVLDKPIFSDTSYFREADSFERRVKFSKVSKSGNGVLIGIDVRVKEKNRASAWLSRNYISYSTIVMEKPQR